MTVVTRNVADLATTHVAILNPWEGAIGGTCFHETDISQVPPMIACEPTGHTSRASLITRWLAARSAVLRSLYLAALLSVAISTVVIAGCAQQPLAAQAAVAPVAAPTSIHALLSNVESALNDGSLASDAFYTDAHLRQFFGASGLKWILNTDTDKYAQLLGVAYVPVLTKRPARLGVTWIRLDSQQKKSVSGKAHAAFSLACSCALRVEAIEEVFGQLNRTVTPARRLESMHAPRPRDPTDPLGNQIITYDIDTTDSHISTLSVAFDPDGNITLIEARQREK